MDDRRYLGRIVVSEIQGTVLATSPLQDARISSSTPKSG